MKSSERNKRLEPVIVRKDERETCMSEIWEAVEVMSY